MCITAYGKPNRFILSEKFVYKSSVISKLPAIKIPLSVINDHKTYCDCQLAISGGRIYVFLQNNK
jgi:hypothetical protein